jgi:hypothetical protein
LEFWLIKFNEQVIHCSKFIITLIINNLTIV